MIKINLIRSEVEKKDKLAVWIESLLESLPPSAREKLKEHSDFYKRPVFIKIVAALVGLYIVGASVKAYSVRVMDGIAQEKKEISQKVVEAKKTEQRLKDNSKEVVELEELQKEKLEISKKIEVLNSISGARFKIFRVMDKISGLIPDKVWITNMTVEGKNINLKGSSWEFKPISLFESRLKETGFFSSVYLESINTSSANINIEKFSLPNNLELLKNFQIQIVLKDLDILNDEKRTSKIYPLKPLDIFQAAKKELIMCRNEKASKRLEFHNKERLYLCLRT